MGTASPYCASRFQSVRRHAREVRVGNVYVGADHPIRIQSMTTTETLDVEATYRQTVDLVEAGCEIVRITAPNVRTAKALGSISKKLRSAHIDVPLVADIHFLPNAAMEAVKHVEKVRINPGNFADKKKFKIREYTDHQYENELSRLHDTFSPLVLRCKDLGRSMRIGTNHGSLSDRIMNRFGDTPKGMAESALEFLRIARSHSYDDIILSMKASNPKVMIEAYRLVVSMMNDEDMLYPLHLGVTEAGEGEDARIKSAIGIGSLLLDGLGDTIRVSLTEDPVAEIPVARDLVRKAEAWGSSGIFEEPNFKEIIDPFKFRKRHAQRIELSPPKISIGGKNPPVVLATSCHSLSNPAEIIRELAQVQVMSKDAPLEGLVVDLQNSSEIENLQILSSSLFGAVSFIVVVDNRTNQDQEVIPSSQSGSTPFVWFAPYATADEPALARFLTYCEQAGHQPALSFSCSHLLDSLGILLSGADVTPIVTISPSKNLHTVAEYRILAAFLAEYRLDFPIWIRNDEPSRLFSQDNLFSSRLIDASILSGSLLCDGIGDLISVENTGSLNRNRGLSYNLLQGARARISKTEFVACPSCGRTLFDLQSTTQKVKKATGHLKGVTIAVMGCIVNGPGEMADADFGYVGSGPGKIDLYVGKERVKSAVAETHAVDRLIELIKEEGKWIDQ